MDGSEYTAEWGAELLDAPPDSLGSSCKWIHITTDAPKAFDNISRLAVSPDSTWTASLDDFGKLVLWETVTEGRSRVCQLENKGGNRASFAFSPDSLRLASTPNMQDIAVWDISLAKLDVLATLKGHTDLACSIMWSPDGRRLASASLDQTIRIWNGLTYESLLEGLAEGLHNPTVLFSQDGMFLAVCYSKRCCMWDPETGGRKYTLTEGSPAAFSPDDRRIATGYQDGSMHTWDAQTGEELVTLHKHHKHVWDISFSRNGMKILSASQDRTVKICDSITGDELLLLEGHNGPVYKARFSPDNQYIASASWDKTVRLWRRADGECIATFTEYNSTVRCVEFSPDGRTLSSGADNGTVFIRALDDLV